jgi:hypothetical protein
VVSHIVGAIFAISSTKEIFGQRAQWEGKVELVDVLHGCPDNMLDVSTAYGPDCTPLLQRPVLPINDDRVLLTKGRAEVVFRGKLFACEAEAAYHLGNKSELRITLTNAPVEVFFEFEGEFDIKWDSGWRGTALVSHKETTLTPASSASFEAESVALGPFTLNLGEAQHAQAFVVNFPFLPCQQSLVWCGRTSPRQYGTARSGIRRLETHP